MGIAFLLLGLLPLMFLPDLLESSDASDDSTPDSVPNTPVADGDLAEDQGDLLVDPETTDPEDANVLAPNDEDDQPDAGTQNPDPLDVLLALIEDDSETPSDGSEGNVLLPVDQIETDAESIWVNFDDDAGLGYAEIEDFQAGQDVLHIVISPNSIVGDIDLEVVAARNGLDADVYLEQQLVAILKGAANASVADVIIEIDGAAA